MRSTPVWSAKTASNTSARKSRGSKVATGKVVSAAVVNTSAAQTPNPATAIATRAVPRSRIVARRARYSSISRDVMRTGSWLRQGQGQQYAELGALPRLGRVERFRRRVRVDGTSAASNRDSRDAKTDGEICVARRFRHRRHHAK